MLDLGIRACAARRRRTPISPPVRCAQLSVGLFLLVSKMTGKKGLGLVASSASTVVNVAMTAARAPTVGLEKGGLAFWGVMNSAIALLALMNEK